MGNAAFRDSLRRRLLFPPTRIQTRAAQGCGCRHDVAAHPTHLLDCGAKNTFYYDKRHHDVSNQLAHLLRSSINQHHVDREVNLETGSTCPCRFSTTAIATILNGPTSCAKNSIKSVEFSRARPPALSMTSERLLRSAMKEAACPGSLPVTGQGSRAAKASISAGGVTQMDAYKERGASERRRGMALPYELVPPRI
ncbi:hypothetical protein B484DRAFT_125267 [Ochromonadaceae sp. CCMP2298]|nr:hypothetical protein B484DRAFT_125267 [Ochromonadaceae sp. CCMP2298]